METRETEAKPDLAMEKKNRTARRAAEEQWAEAQPPLATADLRPCRDSFH